MTGDSLIAARGAEPQATADTAVWRRRSLTWIVALTIGALHGWAGRHFMNIDGMSYMDLADAYRRGDWWAVINGHWSPLYPILQAAGAAVLRPSPYWESGIAHVVNFGIFIGAFAAFEFLLNGLMRWNRQSSEAPDGPQVGVSDWALQLLGYALFLWATLRLITLSLVSPDLLLAAFIFLAAGLMIRIRLGEDRPRTWSCLGAALGLGYLAKAPMFPLAFVFLISCLVLVRLSGRSIWRVGLAAAVFLTISAPQVAALSYTKGRVTFGESRVLAYAWFIQGAPYRHWQGDPAAGQNLVHPTRRVLTHPDVFEFATPIKGTYPVWYDPSYWYEGTRPGLNVQGQIRAVIAGAREYHTLFLSYIQSSLVVGFLILLFMVPTRRLALQQILSRWVLLVPAVAGLTLFLLMFVLPRYVAPFVVLLWLALYSSVRLPQSVAARRAIDATVAVVIVMLTLVLVIVASPIAYRGAREVIRGEAATGRSEWQVVEALHRLGIRPGDLAAAVHPPPPSSSGGMAGWAWLADLRIVAEIPPDTADEFWHGDSALQERALRALANTGARVAVTMRPRPEWPSARWQQLGSSDYYAYDLTGLADPSPR